jgi:CRISPR system Cascade subunit CasC
MLLELHLIQNFAPSNLNRDDTGSPKECEFGGYTRARISSQSLKRAMRETFRNDRLIDPQYLATRTARAVGAVADQLVARGKPREEATHVATAALTALDIKMDGEKSSYLLFLSQHELSALASICLDHWDALAASLAPKGKDATALPNEVKSTLKKALDGRRAADLALFGRMIADLPDKNVDGSSQVAHAISTHRVSTEFDFFTAVDDLKRHDEDAGAGMLGTVQFNSACFYRYANLDVEQIAQNIGPDPELMRRGVWAFIRATISAIPTGKQNSMAAHNLPSFVMVVVREGNAWNLANAFVKPARASHDRDLVQDSIMKLDGFWGRMADMYGTAGVQGIYIATMEPDSVDTLKPHLVKSGDPSTPKVDVLVSQALDTATGHLR